MYHIALRIPDRIIVYANMTIIIGATLILL